MSIKPIISNTIIGNQRDTQAVGILHLFGNDTGHLLHLVLGNIEVELIVYLQYHAALQMLALQ